MNARTYQRRPRAKNFSLLLGANNSGSAGGKFSAAGDERIRAITRRHFPDGFTILEANGGWLDAKKGKFIREESRQIMVVADSSARLRPWCAELARALKQKELLVTEIGPVFAFRAKSSSLRSRESNKPDPTCRRADVRMGASPSK